MITVALAGKPNAGKSTFFNAATAADVDVGNYPFTTIDPNRGVSAVRTECPCVDRDDGCGSSDCHEGVRFVPIELVDVAGLVPGAHEGRGLGNQFLDALTDADVIISVIDASGGTNEEGEPVDVGTADPRKEISFIEEEMDQWLAGIIRDNWETVMRQSRAPDFDLERSLLDIVTGVGATRSDLIPILREREFPEKPDAWTDEEKTTLAVDIRARTKPMVTAANKADIAPRELLESLESSDRTVIPCTAEGERALRRGADAGVLDYLSGDETFEMIGEVSDDQRHGLQQIKSVMDHYGGTGVQAALNVAVYDRLDQMTVYPVENETHWTDGSGNMLPDALLLPKGATPPALAEAIHSDIADGYLHAVDARSNRRIGEGHELQEGDVIKIVSTA